MEMIPLVSVLMTAYNREKYIAEAIESVLASSFTNFELIICDDCSTDNTVGIAKRFLSDGRVKIVVNDTNLQQFENRNKAASLAKGKYLKYVDSDDVIYPHALQIMVQAMEDHPDCGVGFCLYHTVSKFKLPHKYSPEEIYLEHYFADPILFIGPVGTIISKAAFEKVGGFSLYGMPSDSHFMLKIAAQFPVVTLYRDLVWWRQHDEQAFNGETDPVNIFHNLQFNTNVLTSVHCPLKEPDRLRALKNLNKIFMLNLFRRSVKSPANLSVFNKMIQERKLSVVKILSDIIK